MHRLAGPVALLLMGLCACLGGSGGRDSDPGGAATDLPDDRGAPPDASPDASPRDLALPDPTPVDPGPPDLPGDPAPDGADDLATDGLPTDSSVIDHDTLGLACRSHGECGEGRFCRRDDGTCTGTGTCEASPTSFDCGPIGDAVCGCDGQNYGGRCWANHFGVNLRSTQACPLPTLCGDGVAGPCPEGSACQPREGTCGTSGVCQVVPLECPPDDYAVCGCDDRTYASRCIAWMAGVGLQRAGACGSMAACATTDGCPVDEYCMKPAGACDASVQGKCDLRPVDCFMTRAIAPQCGCDGDTYANPCWVAAAGTTIAVPGECEGDVLCASNDGCGQGLYCWKKAGTCGLGYGVCRPLPTECPTAGASPGIAAATVCGCDLVAYDDACHAALVGTPVKHDGNCVGPSDSYARYRYSDDAQAVEAAMRVVAGPDQLLGFDQADVFEEAFDPDGGSVTLTVVFRSVEGPSAGHAEVTFPLPLPANLPFGMGTGYQGTRIRWFDGSGAVAGDLDGTILVWHYEAHASARPSVLEFTAMDLTAQ